MQNLVNQSVFPGFFGVHEAVPLEAGKTGTAPQLGSKAKYVYFDNTLKHNIPDVFWNFMNQKGSVFENGKMVENQPVLGSNLAAPWLDATGYPLSEAYWTRVTVGGQAKDVLLQAFERRVLTFTPGNPAAFQVEMGNVGRHTMAHKNQTVNILAVGFKPNELAGINLKCPCGPTFRVRDVPLGEGGVLQVNLS